MNKIFREGVPVVAPEAYYDEIIKHPDSVALLMASSPNHLKFVDDLVAVPSGYHSFAVALTPDQTHLVEVARLPRLRVYKNGIRIHNILMDESNSSSLRATLNRLNLK